jgi:hypothetical protein
VLERACGFESLRPHRCFCGVFAGDGVISSSERADWARFGHGMGTLQIKSRRHGIEVCVEKVGIDPQRHRRVFVPEHPRQCQHVDPGADRQAGAGVTQVVRRNRLYPSSFDSPPEPSIGRLRPRQIRGAVIAEHQIVEAATLALHRELIQHELGHRHRSLCAALGAAKLVIVGVESFIAEGFAFVVIHTELDVGPVVRVPA